MGVSAVITASLHDLDVGEARGAAQPTDALYRCPPRLRWLAREDFTGATQWPSPFPSCPTHHRLRLHIELCLARARPSDAGRVCSHVAGDSAIDALATGTTPLLHVQASSLGSA